LEELVALRIRVRHLASRRVVRRDELDASGLLVAPDEPAQLGEDLAVVDDGSGQRGGRLLRARRAGGEPGKSEGQDEKALREEARELHGVYLALAQAPCDGRAVRWKPRGTWASSGAVRP